jgi:hypothetical protein
MINRFVKDIHSSFQVLNLKNDSLRRRSDSLKYSVGYSLLGKSRVYVTNGCLGVQVKKVEDVSYDLMLRGLLPDAGTEDAKQSEDVKEVPEVILEGKKE